MPKSITISLPVSDLKASKAFYTALGLTPSPQFPDDAGAMMIWSETITIVLLTKEKWQTMTTRPIPPSTSSEVGLMLSCESRAEVDAMNDAASQHGGIADINPIQDHEFMYGRDFTDPDGHVLGAMWVDLSMMGSPCGQE